MNSFQGLGHVLNPSYTSKGNLFYQRIIPTARLLVPSRSSSRIRNYNRFRSFSSRACLRREGGNMSSNNVPHVIRTAADPRQSAMYTVFLSDAQQVNEDIRLIRLSIPTSEVIPYLYFIHSLHGLLDRFSSASRRLLTLTSANSQTAPLHPPPRPMAGRTHP